MNLKEAIARVRELDREIPGIPGYLATSNGEILSVESNWRGYGKRILRSHPNKDGYLRVRILINGRRIKKTVHGLVCSAFHGPNPGGLQVRHKDGSRTNNRPENLCWGTAKENAQDRIAHGTNAAGERNGWYKKQCKRGHDLSVHGRKRVNGGGRACRKCDKVHQERAKAKDPDAIRAYKARWFQNTGKARMREQRKLARAALQRAEELLAGERGKG